MWAWQGYRSVPVLPRRAPVGPWVGWWSGRCGWWWSGRGGVPQVRPGAGPGPARGQVEHEAAPGGRQAGGDGDDAAAQGRPAGGGHGRGDGRGAGEVERQGRERDPGRVGGVAARGQVGQGSVLELGDHLLDDRVGAVALVGLDGVQGRVGDERVVTPVGEQLALHGPCLLYTSPSPRD